ncbi:MAG: hypothetical protein OXU77_21860 [Gammaproteobacteria bacterium]|nr:hypothetical protein [Gammaproteobacteria bacterium]
MKRSGLPDNPFKVFTPEDLDAKEILDLFVEVPYLNKIQDPGNTMLNGPRGSGKSMLFRYLMPDCQMEAKSLALRELPFFGVLVSIRNTAPNLTELRRLPDQSTRAILNEHALSCFVASRFLQALLDSLPDRPQPSWSAALASYYDYLESLLVRSGRPAIGHDGLDVASPQALLQGCRDLCEDSYADVNHYAKRISFATSLPPYDGVLCDYMTFLCPLLVEARKLPFLPNEAPIYLLLDDADHLNKDQTMVLNSWLTARTQGMVSIKISTQQNYKTLATVSGHLVRSPHDYQEINMSDLYTTKRGLYERSVREIVDRRLRRAKIASTGDAFFPPDRDQELEITQIAEDLRKAWKDSGRGNRPSDDALRYARPEYIRRLGGPSKSRHTYFYAGLDQLIHLSSGQVRYLLQPAAEMYDEQVGQLADSPIREISPGIQNRVVRQEADRLMFSELENLAVSPTDVDIPFDEYRDRVAKLRNLLAFLGGFFFLKLVSDDAERRVFSVAVSGDPDLDVFDVFEFGVVLGYFHRSSIGNKDGTGRTRLYVLTRRLAPHFNLDPSSFSGYQFVTNETLRSAMVNPARTVRAVRSRVKPRPLDEGQMELF